MQLVIFTRKCGSLMEFSMHLRWSSLTWIIGVLQRARIARLNITAFALHWLRLWANREYQVRERTPHGEHWTVGWIGSGFNFLWWSLMDLIEIDLWRKADYAILLAYARLCASQLVNYILRPHFRKIPDDCDTQRQRLADTLPTCIQTNYTHLRSIHPPQRPALSKGAYNVFVVRWNVQCQGAHIKTNAIEFIRLVERFLISNDDLCTTFWCDYVCLRCIRNMICYLLPSDHRSDPSIINIWQNWIACNARKNVGWMSEYRFGCCFIFFLFFSSVLDAEVGVCEARMQYCGVRHVYGWAFVSTRCCLHCDHLPFHDNET